MHYRLLYLFSIILILTACISKASKIRKDEWAKKVIATSLNNFYKLNDSIYRSEQPDNLEFSAITKAGIKSILNLRHDRSDTFSIRLKELQYFHIKMRTKKFSDAEIIEALQIIKNAPKPLLIHCRHGADRTGIVAALYRIIFENWTKEQALEELQNGGYGFHTMYHNIPAYINDVDIDHIKQMVIKND